jgi:hypothetical protein
MLKGCLEIFLPELATVKHKETTDVNISCEGTLMIAGGQNENV